LQYFTKYPWITIGYCELAASYRALELYADSIGVVEYGGAGDCLFLVFAFFMRLSIL
jgi:hypothetical protein